MHPAGVLVEALVDEELAPGDGAVGVQSLSLTICSSERKKNEVWGLMSSRAWWPVVFEGAMAMPFEPVGSGGIAVVDVGGFSRGALQLQAWTTGSLP